MMIVENRLIERTTKFRPNETRRDVDLERRLGFLVDRTVKGKMSFDRLYSLYQMFEDRVTYDNPNFLEDEKSNLLLKYAFSCLYQLHDRFAREQPNMNFWTELSNILLGRADISFTVECDKRERRIIYLSYTIGNETYPVRIEDV
ncbi:hypothetical protein HYT58_03160 [Candidatus Woesearchaeota archaeon]|nr:hypothetical protein [Candidatus Woesearchaeota archaeon]